MRGGRLIHLLRRYAQWLHLRWPAGKVEPLPALGADGATSVPGVYVAHLRPGWHASVTPPCPTWS